MTKIRVVAAVVDTIQLTLYKEDGTTVSIPQGDPRLRRIVDEITPIVSQNLVATVELSSIENTSYREFEEQTGGVTRFFRVAKKAVSRLFGSGTSEDTTSEPVEPTQIGKIPDRLVAAIDDIMANAVPTSDDRFHDDTDPETTVVAVVETDGKKGKQKAVIPGVASLEPQFKHALKLGSTIGVQRFLERIGKVIATRRHSIDDLLRFMEKGDLPIAEDGSIVIYKILRRKSGVEGTFVDCHSGNVPQRVGSYVCMDPSMVDPNRRNECSNGLHVARRGYLGNFPGDVCVLAKVDPEDVIAVPEYDANKMRVCGYHILFELDDHSFEKLRANRPMTDNPAVQALLGRALKGHHVGRLEEVRITQQRGGGVKITPLNGAKAPKVPVAAAPKAKAIPDPVIENKRLDAPQVDPKAVADRVTETRTTKAGLLTRRELAQDIWNRMTAATTNADRRRAARDLIAFRKAVKVGWQVLGFDQVGAALVELHSNLPDDPAPAKPTSKPTTSRKAQVADMIDAMKAAEGVERIEAAKRIVAFKKKAKVSWSALGVNPVRERDILFTADMDPAQFKPAPKKAASKPAAKKKAVKPASPLPFPTGTRKQIARELFNQGRWSELGEFRRSAKVGWGALGFNSQEAAMAANKTN